MKPTVILRIDEAGNHCAFFTGDVDVFWVDESCPKDRVFKSSNQVEPDEIKRLLGNDTVGFTGDGSAASIRAKRAEAFMNSERFLNVVPDKKR